MIRPANSLDLNQVDFFKMVYEKAAISFTIYGHVFIEINDMASEQSGSKSN